MTQADLFTTSPRFDGATLDIERDQSRLARQLTAVRLLMLDGQWRTLGQIHDLTGYPESSVSARLRDLRKLKFGGYDVQRRRLSGGLFAYRVGSTHVG